MAHWFVDLYTYLFTCFALIYLAFVTPLLVILDLLNWLGFWRGRLTDRAEDSLWVMVFFSVLFLILVKMRSDVKEIKARLGS
jgi:hypothetical protein